jgi:predicted Zn-dependent protease
VKQHHATTHLTALKAGWRRIGIALALSIASIPAGLHGTETGNLPNIGDPAASVMSPAQEVQLGSRLLREIRRGLPLERDPLINSYVQALGQRLLSDAPDAHGGFHFLVVDDAGINAFAAPGGIVAVNTGLIETVRSEAELAAVMAHEIAHVTQRHLARQQANQSQLSFATGLAIIAAMIAATYDAQLGQAAVMSTVGAGAQAQLNYSRSFEQEADRIGLTILVGAGYEPRAMPAFFERLYQAGQLNPSSVPEFLRTHPMSESRLNDTQARAEQYEGEYREDSDAFRLARARLQGLAMSPARIIESYAKASHTADEAPFARYTYALGLMRSGRNEEALDALIGLERIQGGVLHAELTAGEILIQGGRAGEAADRLARVHEVYPGYAPATLTYAQALLRAERPAEALLMLDALRDTAEDYPESLKLRAEAARHAGALAASHEAMCDYYLLFGQPGEALAQLEFALALPDLNDQDAERLRSKRAQLLQQRKDAEKP